MYDDITGRKRLGGVYIGPLSRRYHSWIAQAFWNTVTPACDLERYAHIT